MERFMEEKVKMYLFGWIFVFENFYLCIYVDKDSQKLSVKSVRD